MAAAALLDEAVRRGGEGRAADSDAQAGLLPAVTSSWSAERPRKHGRRARSIASSTRDGAVPKVEIHDPLKPHVDLLGKLTDPDIHNVTAYLVTLK